MPPEFLATMHILKSNLDRKINSKYGQLNSPELEDSFLHKGLREELIEYLKRQNISTKILEAFREVPRHLFLESSLERKAYMDIALPILFDQTISRPLTVARQTELLEPKEGDKVLEIGTGSGFQAMILAALKTNVYTIERHRDLYLRAKNHKLNNKFRNSIHYFHGDGYLGLKAYQPFDKILVTAGASEIPKKLLSQLKYEGIMVIPVGEGDNQKMLKIKRLIDDKLEITNFGNFSFVPMLEGLPKSSDVF